jgi:hypothetical protein
VVELPKEFAGAAIETVGGASAEVVKQSAEDLKLKLLPFAVSVVTTKD